jgi:hypothetical protein
VRRIVGIARRNRRLLVGRGGLEVMCGEAS